MLARSTLAASLGLLLVTSTWAEEKIDFARSILPLLSDKCFTCHGPDEASREAGLRLDDQKSAYAELDSGDRAIVPFNLAESGIIDRILTDDPDILMPPPDSGKSITPQERELLKSWIAQGAEWSGHWAFESPELSPMPNASSPWRSANSIDQFIHAKLRAANLAPAQRADKETLIRRVTLDLTGLPPSIAEVDEFLADASPNAYEGVVNRLLDSVRYGEHMGRIWLDAARYADTHGLHLDNERSVWPYRNWVINAFNRNLPFDEFTLQQLAGDLMPATSLDQRIATGFNRCNVTTSEGGSIDEEYYVRYAIDRVETTSTVWMGLTAGCAACHDHKFDPLTQREFYQLFSYFYSLTEKAMDGNALLPPPSVKAPSRLHTIRRNNLETQRAAVDEQLAKLHADINYQDASNDIVLRSLTELEQTWFDDSLPGGAQPNGDGESAWQYVEAPDHPVFSGEKATRRESDGLSQQYFEKAEQKLKVGAHDRFFTYVYLDPENPPETIQLQFHRDSWDHRAYWGADKGYNAGKKGTTNHRMGDLPATGEWVRLEVPAGDVGLSVGSEINGWSFAQSNGTVYWDKAGIISVLPLNSSQLESLSLWTQFREQVRHPALPGEIQAVLDVKSEERSADQQAMLRKHFFEQVHPSFSTSFEQPIANRASLNQQLAGLEKSIPATLVMEDLQEPRQAHVLERGEYTLQREKVDSQTPEWILPRDESSPANRLGLAQWLVNPKHPLTARVTVNRYWQHFFGTGLVKTSEDFGIQGEYPSHPELLDWLAIDFITSGWNTKRMHKQIVMSMTYQQSSHFGPDKLAVDPENRLLARGPSYRLDAEVIRDQALSVSGLLVGTIGGKSVRPYQPAGLWKPVGFGGSNTSVFKQDDGPNLYRRSMYTFWKRTAPPPSMSTFDAPDRETCQVRRARTNTPLQALVLMNDVQFVEAAREFAVRVLTEGGDDVDTRLIFAFRTATSRRPTDTEIHRLKQLLTEYQAIFKKSPEAAKAIISNGDSKPNGDVDPTELSAWTIITHLLLNLSETVTKA